MIPNEKLSFAYRSRVLKALIGRESVTPASLTMAVLRLWRDTAYPDLPTKAICSKALSANPNVRSFAAWLSELPFFEAAFWLSSAYARWVDAAQQKARALFFTPPALANRLIDDLIANGASLTQGSWLDPACGGAAFLAPVSLRMAEALAKEGLSPTKIIAHISNHLAGNDIDATLCELSREFVNMALNSFITRANGKLPALSITTMDGLSYVSGMCRGADVVICNPPYRKMKAKELEDYSAVFDDVIEGQANIYALFFKQCLLLTHEDGLAGLLTPTSFLSGKDFSKLRTALLSHSDVKQLDLVSNRVGVFIGVEQETAISILKRTASKASVGINANIYSLEAEGDWLEVGRCHLPNSGLGWPVPRSVRDVEILQSAGRSKFRLTDYGFRPRVGAYVDYRDRFTHNVYSHVPSRLLADDIFPVIWSRDIGTDGTFVLGRNGAKSKHARFIRLDPEVRAAVLRNPCIALQRVTASEQPRRLVGAVVDAELIKKYGGVVGENHIVFLEQLGGTPTLSPDELRALLSTGVIDRLFRSISAAVNVSVFELDQLPLPCPNLLKQALSRTDNLEEAVEEAFRQTVGYTVGALTSR